MSERPRRAVTCRSYAGSIAIIVAFSCRETCLTMKRETEPWRSLCITRKKKEPLLPSETLSLSFCRQCVPSSERSSGKARAYVDGWMPKARRTARNRSGS